MELEGEEMEQVAAAPPPKPVSPLVPIVTCIATLANAARARASDPFSARRRRAFALRGADAAPTLHERANVKALGGVPSAVQNVLTRIALRPNDKERVDGGTPLQDALRAIVTTETFSDWRTPVSDLVEALEKEVGLLLATVYTLPDLRTPRERTSIVCVFQLAGRPIGCSFDHEMYALAVLLSVPGAPVPFSPSCVIVTRHDEDEGKDPDDPLVALPAWSGHEASGRVDIDGFSWLPSSAYMDAVPTAQTPRTPFLVGK